MACCLVEDVSENELVALPGDLQGWRVRSLCVRGNQLSGVPASIGWLQSLRTLDLACNRIDALPLALGELGKLETLYLQQNRIAAMPPLAGCHALKVSRRRHAPPRANAAQSRHATK